MHVEMIRQDYNDPKMMSVLENFMKAAIKMTGDIDTLAEVYMIAMLDKNNPQLYWHLVHNYARWSAIYATGASPSIYAHAAFKLVRD